MAIKQNLDDIKARIGSEEQFLEGIIKSERFVKKYKNTLIALLVIFIAWIIGYSSYNYIESSRIKSANASYTALLKDPNNQKELENLKDKDLNLYALYKFKVSQNDQKELNELLKLNIDPILKEIIKTKTKANSVLMSDYNLLLTGYRLLKSGDIDGANAQFAKISFSSPLYKAAKNLAHYRGSKQWEK